MVRAFLKALPLVLVLGACAGDGIVAPVPIDDDCGGVVPGSYIVLFTPAVADVPGRTALLVAKYDATLTHVYEGAIRGFAASDLTSSSAAAIAQEPDVALVGQNRLLCLD